MSITVDMPDRYYNLSYVLYIILDKVLKTSVLFFLIYVALSLNDISGFIKNLTGVKILEGIPTNLSLTVVAILYPLLLDINFLGYFKGKAQEVRFGRFRPEVDAILLEYIVRGRSSIKSRLNAILDYHKYIRKLVSSNTGDVNAELRPKTEHINWFGKYIKLELNKSKLTVLDEIEVPENTYWRIQIKSDDNDESIAGGEPVTFAYAKLQQKHNSGEDKNGVSLYFNLVGREHENLTYLSEDKKDIVNNIYKSITKSERIGDELLKNEDLLFVTSVDYMIDEDKKQYISENSEYVDGTEDLEDWDDSNYEKVIS